MCGLSIAVAGMYSILRTLTLPSTLLSTWPEVRPASVTWPIPAAREASAEEVAMTCGIYRFGAKFMVSPFESDDREACRLFAAAHEERFPNMWTYTAR